MGEPLIADTSGISDADRMDFALFNYQWIRSSLDGDTDIVDQINPVYFPTVYDAGKSIKVRVSFYDDAGNRESLTSEATAIVTGLADEPAEGVPTINGTVRVGRWLFADTSDISDPSRIITGYSYQWVWVGPNGETDIAGETTSLYRVSDDDVWKHIKVRVTVTYDDLSETTLTSPTTRKVPGVPVFVGADDDVPIVVESTAEEYFVLFARPDLGFPLELPVLVALGADGTTTLNEELPPLPRAHYRVEKYLIADPADTDGDGIDDMSELADPARLNPLNPAGAISFVDGALAIPDRETFEALSYQGNDVPYHGYLRELEFVKFYIVDIWTDYPRVYFINTDTHRLHPDFWDAIGRPGHSQLRRPRLPADLGRGGLPPQRSGAGRLPGRLPLRLQQLRDLPIRAGSAHQRDPGGQHAGAREQPGLPPSNGPTSQHLSRRKGALRRLPGRHPAGRRHRARHPLPPDESRRGHWPFAPDDAGGAPGPGRRGDLRDAAQRALGRCRDHHHRAPDTAVPCQFGAPSKTASPTPSSATPSTATSTT